MNRLVILADDTAVALAADHGAHDAGFLVEIASEEAELLALLRTGPEAVGFLWGRTWADTVSQVKAVRGAHIRNLLFSTMDMDHLPSGQRVKLIVKLLGAGADDAQPWPVDPRELAARLTALAGRTRDISDAPVPLPGGFYCQGAGTVVGENCTIHLTRHEQRVFQALVDHAGCLVTKGQLMLALYQGMDEPQEKIVDVFVCKLRKKLAPVTADVEVVETVWGQGYRFVPHGFRPQRVAALKRVAVRP